MDMDKYLENANIAEICRACFEVCEQYKKLTDDVENFPNRKLGDIFFDVVQIELKSSADISPSRLCLPCSKDLLSANKFIQKCQQNNERFLEFLRNTNIKQPDCLSEFPIDIPTGSHSSDLLQIKIETEELTEFTADTLTDEKASAHSSSDSEASDYELPRHEVQKINKMQCVYCDRVFKRADFLENHRRKHEEEFKRKGEAMGNCSLSVGDESETVCNTATEQNTHGLTNRPNSDSSAYQNNSNEKCDKEFFRLQGSSKPMTIRQTNIKGNSDANDILQLKYEISNLKETCLKEFSEIKALILNQNTKKLEVNVKETSNFKKRIKEIEDDNTRIITPLEFDKLFPMNSDDDLRTLNDIGEKHKLFAIQTVRQLVHHGGLCTNMNKIFGNKIVVNYNYEGKSGKKSLKDFVQVNEILFRAAFTSGYTMHEYENDLRKGFKIMKNRYFKNECIKRKKYYDNLEN